MQETYFIDTMGCQMNERDSETIAGILEALGYRPAPRIEDARIIVLNTCAVREKPVHKVFSKLGEIRLLKRRRPDIVVIVTGCVAQVATDEFQQRAPFVNAVIGPRNLSALAEVVGHASSHPAFHTDDAEVIPEGLPFARTEGVNAFVNVSYGCDNFCSYCIVPYARGREQSRAPEAVAAEARAAVQAGFPEVTLLGQNVNSYAGVNADGNTLGFPELLALVSRIEGLQRLRFTTSHPKDLSPRLLDAMADLPPVCEYLHLPIQAGDDQILARMGRGYTYAHYRGLIEAARERVPGIAITTDVIVGFPGETREQFERTLAAFREIRYDQAFTFIYSDRPGTRAEGFDGKLPEAEKLARLQELAELQNEISREVNAARLGEVVEVLVEGPDPRDPAQARGRTRTNKLVIFSAPAACDLRGRMVQVRAEQAFLWGFKGSLATTGE